MRRSFGTTSVGDEPVPSGRTSTAPVGTVGDESWTRGRTPSSSSTSACGTPGSRTSSVRRRTEAARGGRKGWPCDDSLRQDREFAPLLEREWSFPPPFEERRESWAQFRRKRRRTSFRRRRRSSDGRGGGTVPAEEATEEAARRGGPRGRYKSPLDERPPAPSFAPPAMLVAWKSSGAWSFGWGRWLQCFLALCVLLQTSAFGGAAPLAGSKSGEKTIAGPGPGERRVSQEQLRA